VPNQPIQSSYTVTANDTQSGYNATTVTLANTAAAPSYDHDGNLNGDGARQMAFDGDGNLGVVVSASGARTEFVYDGLHRLRQRNEFSDPGGSHLVSQTSYAYDGRQPIQEGDHTGAHYVDYTLGRDLSGQVGGAAGIGGYLARTEDAQTANPRHRYFHADVAGNITGLLNDADNELVRYLYDPYGNLLGKWGSFADVNLIRHASKEYNVNGGLYLYPFRAYDPHFHRWMSQDPIREWGGINLYQFVGNNPMGLVDPYGLDFHLGGGGALLAPGPFGYLSGDTGWENLASGAYNVVPEIGNIGSGLLNALSALDQSILDSLHNILPSDPQIAGGIYDAMAFLPIGDMSDCGKAGKEITFLYQKLSGTGQHLKFGITSDLARRYSAAELNGGSLKVIAQGDRADMLRLERDLHQALPLGIEEGQSFYIQKQVQNGLLPPSEYPFQP